MNFPGYDPSIIADQVDMRMTGAHLDAIPQYCEFSKQHSEKTDFQIDTLMTNVSCFFRDPLVFSYLHSRLLPKLISEKSTSTNPFFRIWSAGCATGEEPYSLAMDIHDILDKMHINIITTIFATDIDTEAINKGRKAVYKPNKYSNIRFEYLKHFTQTKNDFYLKPEIKRLVHFSRHNLLDKKSYSPPESIYGGFDIILCRNVLIYYGTDSQNRIFTKLYRSLNTNGYLILGEAETLTNRFRKHFKRVVQHSQIFQKIN